MLARQASRLRELDSLSPEKKGVFENNRSSVMQDKGCKGDMMAMFARNSITQGESRTNDNSARSSKLSNNLFRISNSKNG